MADTDYFNSREAEDRALELLNSIGDSMGDNHRQMIAIEGAAWALVAAVRELRSIERQRSR